MIDSTGSANSRSPAIESREQFTLDHHVLRGFFGLVAFGVLWEGIARAGLVQGLFFAPISKIAVEAWSLYSSGEILPHLGYTLANFMSGFLLGTLVAIPLGLLLGWKRRLLDYVDPIISIALATPIIVLVPLIISSFGIFWQSKVAITTWAVFFPVLISMIAGVQAVDSSLVRVARSFQAGDTKIITAIVLPGSVPTLVSGLRLGMTRGLIGVLAAEFFGAPRGLGYLAFSFGTTFQPAKMFVAIFTMAILGIMLTSLMHYAQRKADAWRVEQR